MKKTKFQRLIALLLASLLLMGAMTCLVASADEVVEDEVVEDEVVEATVSIAYKNVAYEAAAKLVFYVESANLPEGAAVKLAIFDEEPVAIDETAVLRSAFGKLSVEGAEYDAFASDEIDFKNLRNTLYAVAVVIDAEGGVVAQSDVLAYSVFDYCMDRFDMQISAEQNELYKTLLDFGAAVQALNFDDSNIDEVGGWANAYYGVKVENSDGTNVSSTTKYYYTSKDVGVKKTITVDKFAPVGKGYACFDSAEFSDPMLRGFVDGYEVSYTILSKIGYSSVTCKYAGAVSLAKDFEIGKKPAFDGMNFCENPVAALPTTDADGDGIMDGRYWIAEEENGNTYLRYYDNNDGGSKNWSFTKDTEDDKSEYVIEFDFRWGGAKSFRDDGSRDVIYNNGIGGTRGNLGMFSSSSDGQTLTMLGKSLKVGEWHTITYRFVANEANDNFDIFVSIDGEQVTKTSGGDITFVWEPRWGAGAGKNDIIFDIDNLIYYSK